MSHSRFENTTFEFIMNYHKEKDNEEIVPYKETNESIKDKENSGLKITSLAEAIDIYYKLFSERIPKKETKKEIHKYIIEQMKKEDELDLNEKYIFSIYIAMNKHLLSKEIKKDILEEEFHLTLMKWLMEERKLVADEIYENKNIYNFNIFIGLLINIISLLEILPIKSSDLFEFNLYKKLFKLNKFVQLNKNKNKNISLSFLINKIENILQKWKTQMDCYELAQKIQKFNEKKKEIKFLKKKKKRNEMIIRDKEDTEADSSSDREPSMEYKLGGLFIKNKYKIMKQKKVNFDFNNNQIFFFDKEEKVSTFLNNKSNNAFSF